jgi:hypothetical protein
MTTEELPGRPHRSAAPVLTSLPSVPSRLLPWLVPLLTGVLALRLLGLPAGDTARYALYFAACVVLPGVLLMRAIWRSTGNWAEDVGLGATVGFAYELVGWAIFTAAGRQDALVVWPLLLLVSFAVVPGLRRHWRIVRPSPLPVWWSWGVALCLTLLLVTLARAMAGNAVPPDGSSYYPDMLYHLSMVHELVRSVPPELPQVAGERLDYHWFANAQMAAAIDISHSPVPQVLFRLWMFPVAVVAMLTCAALGRQVSQVWWAGVLAPALILPAQVMALFPSSALDLGAPLAYLSPSQNFGLVTGTAAAVFLLEALFRGGGRGSWVLALAVAVVGGGAKPTTLPILLGGIGLAALFLLVRDRRLPWRVVLGGVLLVGTAVITMLTVAGSTSGSGVQFLAVARFTKGYQGATGDHSLPATGGWLLPSLASGDKLALAGGLVAVVTLILGQLLLLVAFALLLVRRTRSDPVAWWLVGALTAGWLGLVLVDHPSASEGYFLRSAVPFGAAAAAWLITVAVRGRSRRTVAVVAASGLALGVLIGGASQLVAHVATGTRPDRIQALAQPVLMTLGLLAVAALVWRLLVRRQPALAGLGLVVLVLVPVGISLTSAADDGWAARGRGDTISSSWRIYPDEQAAAMWLGSHSAPQDVVVANTACRPAGSQGPGCDARGYVVSALAGRRTLIEGWAYTQQAMALHGAGGKPYTVQPSPWPDRTALTNQVLTAPTSELLGRLYREFGVRWIYVDLRHGKVSPQLDRLAVLRHRQSEVRIYQVLPQ